jgi:hypothetical protein
MSGDGNERPLVDNSWLFGALRSAKHVEISPQTQKAFEELESIENLEHFRLVCAEQKRKRGW